MTRRVFLAAATLAAALAAASPASADWQFTRWGMLLPEVLTASEGKAARLPDAPINAEAMLPGAGVCRAQLPGPYVFAGVAFTEVNFCFNEIGRLVAVDLVAPLDAFAPVDQALAATFSQPERRGPGPANRTYVDEKNGDSLHLVQTGSTHLFVRPRDGGRE